MDGFRLVDRFHFAYGEYEFTSVSRAVQAMEEGNEKTSLSLSAKTPVSEIIWTSLVNGAPVSLGKTLSATKDLKWLDAIPEFIMYRRRKWGGWCSQSGKELRESREAGWTKSFPPTFAAFLEAGTNDSSEHLFEVLAEWIERSPRPQGFDQQIWEAGGFIDPLLSRRLIHAGASINCELWKDKRTALQIAAVFWEHSTIRALLEEGADPDHCSYNGFSALHWFLYEEKVSIDSGYLNNKATISKRRNRKSDIASSIKILANSTHGGINHAHFETGRTPLMMAAQISPRSVKTLLGLGAEVDGRDKQDRTAAMEFILSKSFHSLSTSILEDLLKAGANARASDHKGMTLLGYWFQKLCEGSLSHLYAGYNAFNRAFHALANIGILSDPTLLVQELESLKVPIVVASRLGNAQLCLALLSTGVNPNIHGMNEHGALQRNDGSEANDLEDMAWNPLLVALWSKAYVVAALLLAYGANVNFEIPEQARTKYNKYRRRKAGTTPLHIAICAKAELWYELSITLKTSGCPFRAVGHPEWKVSKMSALERLVEYQTQGYKQHDPRNKGEQTSDVRIQKSTFERANTG